MRKRFILPLVAAATAIGLSFTAAGAPPKQGGDELIVELGRHLFFDNRLSGDDGFSCAKCHDPAKAFTDGLEMSASYPGGKYFRNTPTIMNIAEKTHLYLDGRLPASDLPTLVRDHIAESHFMNLDGRVLSERLRQIPYYEETFKKVFGSEPRYGSVLKAVAAFVRTLNSRNIPFERFQAGDQGAISAQAKKGHALFTGKANCASCHSGKRFSDSMFHATGVPINDKIFEEPMRHIVFRRFFKVFGVERYDQLTTDPGRYGVTKQAADWGAFLTPSLREVGRTAPYMHSGVFKTLDEVVDFYNKGGGEGSGLNPLGLTGEEKASLVAFLGTLSGDPIQIARPKRMDYELRKLPEWVDPPIPSDTSIGQLIAPRNVRPIGALGPPPVPPDNPITPAKVELGKMLFFDARTSGDVSTSCASCHDPKLGWGDGNDLSRGYPGTKHWRNSQTAINSAYFAKLFWAGSVTSLEPQAKSAATGGVAGNGDPMMVEERLAQVPDYVRRFKEVFGTRLPLWGDVLRAIATFERAELISRNTRFDRYSRGDKSALSDKAKRGLDLFQGKAGCIQCHNGPNFSDGDFHNLRVPWNDAFEADVQRQITLRFEFFAKGVPEKYYKMARHDLGLYFRSKDERDLGKFRTPHLRELVWTPPYMHNGIFYTLEEVIDFYDKGGGDQNAIGLKSPLLKPLNLTKKEKKDLISFLKHCSSKKMPLQIKSPRLPPYAVMKPEKR